MDLFKKNLRKRYAWVFLLIFALGIALLLEIFGYNGHYFQNKFKGSELEENVTYEEVNGQVYVTISDINKYVHEVSFQTSLDRELNVSFVSYGVNESNQATPIREEQLSGNFDGDVYFRIHDSVKDIRLVFGGISQDEIRLQNVYVHNEFSFNFIRYALYSCVIFLGLFFAKKILLKEKFDLSTTFLQLAIPLGIFYAIMTPFGYSMDEKEHFVRSYNIAQGNFFLDEGEEVLWPSGIQTLMGNTYGRMIPSTYRSFLEGFQDWGTDSYELAYYSSTAEPYLFFAYVVSGSGIFLGRVLHLPFFAQFYLGRIFNVLFSVLIIFLAIKLSGKYQKIFFAVGLIPVVLFQAASYSADMFTNAFALLSISLTLFYRERKQRIGLKDMAILTTSYLLTFLSKIAYFPIALLVFLLPKEQFESKKTSWVFKWGSLFVVFLGVLWCFLYAQAHGIVQWASTGINAKDQVLFILTHPIQYLKVLWTTFNTGMLGLFNGATILLGYCGDLGNVNYFLVLIFLILALASCYQAPRLNGKDKFWLFLCIGGCVLVSITSLYVTFTPVGNSTVLGYQGRYLLPVLAMVLLLFSSSKFRLELRESTCSVLLVLFGCYIHFYALFMILRLFYV